MKSNLKSILAACLYSLLLLIVPSRGADNRACVVKVAVMTLPAGSDGLLHWRVTDGPTTPLQLSTRYFSDGLKLQGNVIQFYGNPVLSPSAQEPPAQPLVTLKIPAGQNLVYILLSSEQDESGQTRWRGNLLNAADWKESSMKVFNACSETIGITAGDKKILLLQGKSVDFTAGDWRETFPVKIFRLKPKEKMIFSSSWRVTAGRRELTFIGGANGSVSVRSLMDLSALPSDDSR